jgi:hypothetical protein
MDREILSLTCCCVYFLVRVALVGSEGVNSDKTDGSSENDELCARDDHSPGIVFEEDVVLSQKVEKALAW